MRCFQVFFLIGTLFIICGDGFLQRTQSLKSPGSKHPDKRLINCVTLPRFSHNLLQLSSSKVADKTFRKESKSPFLDLCRFVVRSSWVCWWTQIILSVISAVILTFANTVRSSGSNQSVWVSGFAFTGIGVFISFFNTFWTWNITRLCRQVVNNKISSQNVLSSFQSAFRIAVGTSLFGSFVTLVGAEQIVGTLASKALSIQGFQPYLPSGTAVSSTLQALDIFLVQANTNALVALFAPNLCFTLLQTQLPRNTSINSTITTNTPKVDDNIEEQDL